MYGYGLTAGNVGLPNSCCFLHLPPCLDSFMLGLNSDFVSALQTDAIDAFNVKSEAPQPAFVESPKPHLL